MAGQQLCLDKWKQADVDLLTKERMLHLLTLPLLVGNQNGLACIVLQLDCAVFEVCEVFFVQLATVDQ
ncbi:hypothetical protein ABB30_04480 [Stenotrophomonas ginsengisoli]|uniref:Uncharacterized protein n=1 Tax=Stenotrophomonas ginsengisoli TaxID=336566 RepID=A0A0R0DJ05_9GAMM|nr:hypothetical protein ABB30_04480 [Stenotrophomonas ginsengisoli]